MALQKQIIEIPVGAGLAEDVDPRILNAPFLQDALNVEFSKAGQLRKRRGYEALAGTNLPTDTTGVNAVFDHAGVPHLYSRTGVWAFDDTANEWFGADAMDTSPIEFSVLFEHASDQKALCYDVAVSGGRMVEVWEADAKVWYQIRDEATGVIRTQPKVLPDIGGAPKIIAMSGKFLVFGQTGAGMYVAGMATNGSAFTTPTVFVTAGVNVFDITCQSTAATVAFVVTAATTGATTIRRVNSSGSILTTTAAGIECELAVAVHVYSTSAILVSGLHASSSTLYLTHARHNATTLAATYSKTNVNSLFGYHFTPGSTQGAKYLHRVTLHKTSSTAVLIAFSGQNIDDTSVRKGPIFACSRWLIATFASGVVTGEVHTLPHMIVSGKAFRPTSYEPCVPFEYYLHHRLASSGVDTVIGAKQAATVLLMVDLDTFTLDNKGQETSTIAHLPIILARYNGDVAGQRNSTKAHLGHCRLIRSLWTHPSPIVSGARPTTAGATRFRDHEGEHVSHSPVPLEEFTSLRLAAFDFDPGPARIVANNNANAVNQGGYLGFFDGSTMGESTLLFDPERFSRIGLGGMIVGSTTFGATNSAFVLSTSTAHEVQFFFQVRDAAGNLHRSAMSRGQPEYRITHSATTPGRATSLHIKFAWPGITWWRGRGGIAPTVVLCLGENSAPQGGPLHVVGEFPLTPWTTSSTSTAINVKGIYSLTWTGIKEIDNDRVDIFPPAYTDGGVLESQSPPPFVDITSGTARMYGISAERTNEVWATKIPSIGIAPEWHGSLTVPSNPSSKYVACASMDEKVLLFTRDRVYVIGAGGPDNLGEGGFDQPELISSDTGCVNKRSVVEGPFGVIFQGSRGFYLVDRSMQISYIGGPIEDTLAGLDEGSIQSATLVPYDQQVRWTSTDDGMIVYDYQRKFWRYQHGEIFHAAMVGGRFTGTVDTANGYSVARERLPTDTNYQDVWRGPGATVVENEIGVGTAWIKVAGLQGYQRIWKILILGEYRALRGASIHGKLTIDIFKNYNYTTSVQTEIVTFGTSVAAAAGDPFQIEIRPNADVAKSEAIAIYIAETASFVAGEFPIPSFEEGVRLSSIALECGVKKTVHRFQTTRT